MEQDARLAELAGSLSLATDLAAGMAQETALRTCLIATELGRALGVRGAALSEVYYTALLRFIGCTAYAHETAWRFGGGDDMAFLRALTPVDVADRRQAARVGLRSAGRGAPPLRRAAAAIRLATDPNAGRKLAAAHCDLAVALAARLGMTERVIAALGQMYERYDGKGSPHGIGGEDLGLPARILHVAFRAEAQRSLEGPGAAVAAVRRRAGGELDPAVAGVYLDHAPRLLALVAPPSVWDQALAAEPPPHRLLPVGGAAAVADAFARYVDVKSPFTLGHSTGVARLAVAAATEARLDARERATLNLAALLHDLGRVSIPNGIWDKPGRLNHAEWERVRGHAYQTERILALTPMLTGPARLAGLHHERVDGSGYHRGLGGSAVERPARLLAAADAYHAMTEERAWRPALTPADAARTLAEEVRAGRFDRETVACVLAAAGQEGALRVRGERPALLSEREAEVLTLLARGLTNQAIAERLVLSPRTVKNHIAHIYEKTGVSGRAAAAVYAVTNDLV